MYKRTFFASAVMLGALAAGGVSVAQGAPAPGSKAADSALSFDPFKKSADSPSKDTALTAVSGSQAVRVPAMVGATNSPEKPLPGTTLTVADASAREGSGGYSSLVFRVTMSKKSPVPVTVQFRTIAGTAKAGEDFEHAFGTLTFPPNSQQEAFSVRVISDSKREPVERLRVELSNAQPSPVTIARATATGTISDEDQNPSKGPKLTLVSTSSATFAEGNAGTKSIGFKVYLSETPKTDVTYEYSTQERTASAYGPTPDYMPITKTAKFAKGTKQLTNTFGVSVVGDKIKEANEYFDVELREPVNATIAYGVGRLYIQNDD